MVWSGGDRTLPPLLGFVRVTLCVYKCIVCIRCQCAQRTRRAWPLYLDLGAVEHVVGEAVDGNDVVPLAGGIHGVVGDIGGPVVVLPGRRGNI